MAKKFFYDKVYNTKRTIINVVIIGACIIGIILCFVLTSNFQGENRNLTNGSVNIKKTVSIEMNSEIDKKIFFTKIENVDLDDVEVEYPEDFDVSKKGEYEIKIKISKEEYTIKASIIDTTKPDIVIKELTIHEGTSYTANDFVDSCTDNSKIDCKIEFYTEGIDEEGEKVDYSKYSKIGEYSIKIVATDESKNEIVKETKLFIVKKGTKITDNTTGSGSTKECKYGTSEYDTEDNLIAIDITSNGCAVNKELFEDNTMTEEINKLMESETTRILKDMESVDITGVPALNRKMSAVTNKTGNGIVGYELRMTITITNNGKTETIVDYKVNSEGKRIFIKNQYKIPS